jgi:hypothetical protein
VTYKANRLAQSIDNQAIEDIYNVNVEKIHRLAGLQEANTLYGGFKEVRDGKQ